MAEHNELGKAGENAAVAYLEEHGYLIRHRNWRKGHFELDIVAAKENELVIETNRTQPGALYINKVLLNGKKFNKYNITHDELVHGKYLKFDLK